MSGSNWEMSGSEWEMEKGNSSCVECVWERCVECGLDWEMSGSELGAFSLGVWIVLLELGVWIGASQALCACERVVSSACERAKWIVYKIV